MLNLNIKVNNILKKNLLSTFHVEPIGHHELGRHYVFSVKADNGESFILKLYGKPERWCIEVTALKRLKGLKGIPDLINSGILEDGTEWVLLEKIPGVILDSIWLNLTDRNKERLLEEMGSYLGTIHKHSNVGYYGPWKECPVSRYRYSNFMEFRRNNDIKIMKVLIEQGLPEECLFKKAYRYLTEFYDVIGGDEPARICHRDYSGRNILVTEKDGYWGLSGIIDFESCQPDDPVIDFGGLFQKIFMNSPTLLNSFLSGYTKTMKLSPVFDEKLKYYLFNLGLHICSWTYQCAPDYYKEGVKLLKHVMKFHNRGII